MNWPSIIIGAGASAWVHGVAFAIFHTLGLTAFAMFGEAMGIASAVLFVVGLLVRAFAESNADDEKRTLAYNERYESRYSAVRATLDSSLEAWGKWSDHGKRLDKRVADLEAELSRLKTLVIETGLEDKRRPP